MVRITVCWVAAFVAVVLLKAPEAVGQPVFEEAVPSWGCMPSKTCREKCEDKRTDAEEKCRKLPKDAKKEREACWRKANEDYASCVKDCDD